MKLREYIEENFLIDRADTGEFVPFKFNSVQNKYYEMLCRDYLEKENFNGLREIIVKARKEGFTSLILAIFVAIMLLGKHAARFLEISYKDDATKQHYRRAKNFALSVLSKNPRNWDKKLESKLFKSENEGSEFVFRHNLASFYCGTASSRTAERGGTVQGVLFSEPAHYPHTEIIRAPEIIEGTRNMVAVGSGLIFQESTANGMNHFKDTWDMAMDGNVDYKPRFFSWRESYTDDQFRVICRGFTDKSMIKQEYPESALEAFLSSGRHFLNQERLDEYLHLCETPKWSGDITDDGHTVNFVPNPDALLKVWTMPKDDEMFLISADVAEGVTGGAYSVAKVFNRTNWEVVAQWRGHADPGDFGRIMVDMALFWNNAVLIPEMNNHGHATLEAIKSSEYPHILDTKTIWPDRSMEKYGFPTNDRTRPLIFSALSNALNQRLFIDRDSVTIREMQRLIKDDGGKVVAQSGFMDTTIASAIGIYCLKFLTVDATYRQEMKDQGRGMTVTSIAGGSGRKGQGTGYR